MIPGDAMKTAYSYVRFSSPEQAKGNSLARQIEASEAFAKQQGWKLDSSLSLRDLGRSAFTPGKQIALKGFLAAIESAQVAPGSVLIVENLDRLSRQQM